MHTSDKIKVVATTVVIGVVVKKTIKESRRQRALREEIRSNLRRDLANIVKASAIVQERIREGHYQDKSISTIMTDLEFEQIVLRNE